ncbi:MAG: hypothetical protein RIQ81_2139 [Pseudomonadota bacterium]|jgi:glycosyltransferase involved in cell wall biosynthesis/Tfp pilus assembly protein PilF
MSGQQLRRPKLALVYGNLPTVEEIDQFRLLKDKFDIRVVASESICGYLTQTSWFQDLECIALKDYDDNPGYLPGLESTLVQFDVVVIKERLGLYAYQAVKAKWRKRFHLVAWVDNLVPFPGADLQQISAIRQEVANCVDAFVVQTAAARQTLLLEGVEDARIFSMRPWVETRINRDAKSRAKALASLGIAEGEFVVTHIGQVEWEEGLYDLAHGIKVAVDNNAELARRLRLVFCGIGSFATELHQRLVQLGIDQRAVYVAPERESINKVLMATDALYCSALSSRDRLEGDPYRIVTAMSAGIPILASRSPVIEEYVGKHRIDFCPGSALSIAEAIEKAVTAKAIVHDIVKKNAAAAAKLFEKNRVADEMFEVFDGISSVPQIVGKGSIDIQIQEVEAKVQSKQYLSAIEIIEGMLKTQTLPAHHEATLHRLIGDSFTKLGDPESGKAAYLKATMQDPYCARGFIGLGTVALLKNSYDLAVINFQKAISLSPEDEMANLGLGLAFHGMGELKEAANWMLKSLELNPENTAAIFSLVKVSYERNEFNELEAVLNRYLDRHPLDWNMLFTLAGAYYRNNKAGEAMEALQKILQANPQDERALELVAEISSTNTSRAKKITRK